MWTLGTNGDQCAKNHAICDGATVIAKVYGKGYPIGSGWSPDSEANARLERIAGREYPLIRAAEKGLTCAS